jgi:hypothetical protein
MQKNPVTGLRKKLRDTSAHCAGADNADYG